MGELKPIGSEKLQGQEKIKRILELTYFQGNNDNANNSTKKHEFVCEGVNGVFGIDKEKDGFYVKKGLNEESLDYIGGMFMKNKNKFRSFGEALKRLELLRAGELNEETRYTLKQKSAPAPEPTPVSAPESEPTPVSAPESEPTPELAPKDEPIPTDMNNDETDGDKETDPIKKVQKTVGKLGQQLRDAEKYLESEDLKSVFNSILSAVDITLLSDEDKDDILNNFEPETEDEPGMKDEPDMEENDSELDEILNNADKTINTPFNFEDDNEDFSDTSLSEDEPQEDDCIIQSNGFTLSVSCGGEFIGEFEEDEDAYNAVKNWKEENNWYPNTWFISDHGNVSLVHEDEESLGDNSFGEFGDEESLDEENFTDNDETEEDFSNNEISYEEEDPFEAHGSYTVSNSGGYEIMISPDGDSAKVKEQDGTISDWLEIEYIDDEDTLDLEPIIDPNGYNIPLNQVMRINKNNINQKSNNELDINELTKFINQSVKTNLSEYFK
jgi:hypothetical protein